MNNPLNSPSSRAVMNSPKAAEKGFGRVSTTFSSMLNVFNFWKLAHKLLSASPSIRFKKLKLRHYLFINDKCYFTNDLKQETKQEAPNLEEIDLLDERKTTMYERIEFKLKGTKLLRILSQISQIIPALDPVSNLQMIRHISIFLIICVLTFLTPMVAIY